MSEANKTENKVPDKPVVEAPVVETVAKLTPQEKAKAAQIAQAEAKATADREAALKTRRAREQAERQSIARMRHSKLGVEKEVGTNPIALPWPQDPSGALTKLRSGGTTAARRVNGDKAKLVKLLKTLEIIAGHAKARFVMDTKSRAEAKENHLSARVRNETAKRKSAEAKAKEYEAAAERTRKNAGL